MGKVDYFLAKRPLIRGHMEFECGDDGLVIKFGNKIFIAIIDAAGHGGDAHAIAIICKNYLETNYRGNLVKTVECLHKYIKSLNKGVVACLCHLNLETGALKYVGIGNISIRRFGSINTRIIYKKGIIGYTIPTPREEMMTLANNDVLILHTDGIKEHFGIEDYPRLLQHNVKTIATQIIRRFGKKDDDAACIALRYHR